MISGFLCEKDVCSRPIATLEVPATRSPDVLQIWERSKGCASRADSTGAVTLNNASPAFGYTNGEFSRGAGEGKGGSGISHHFGGYSNSNIAVNNNNYHRNELYESARGMYYFSKRASVRNLGMDDLPHTNMISGSKSESNKYEATQYLAKVDSFLKNLEEASKGASGYNFEMEKKALREQRIYKLRLRFEEARQAERMIAWNAIDVANGVPGAKGLGKDQQSKVRERARQLELELKELQDNSIQ